METNNSLQIDIAGTRYHLDTALENLVPVDDHLQVIETSKLDIAIDHEWEQSGYYDLDNQCLYEPPAGLQDLPERVIGFSIPSYQELSEAVHTTLVMYAETAELKDTALAALVEDNRLLSGSGLEVIGDISIKEITHFEGTLNHCGKKKTGGPAFTKVKDQKRKAGRRI